MVIGSRFSVKRFLCNDLCPLEIFQSIDQLLQTTLNQQRATNDCKYEEWLSIIGYKRKLFLNENLLTDN